MNRFLFSLAVLVTFAVSLPSPVLAATATPSASASAASDTKKKIEDLKDRIATKVAQLKSTERRAIYGTVKATSITSFTVVTKTRDLKIELTDDITVIEYLKGKRTVLTTDDIAKGDTVTVFGQYDTTLELLKATTVFIGGTIPERFAGKVTARDDKAFTLTIQTAQGQTFTIDIEKTTKALAWDREKKEIIKSGFSKVAIGSSVHGIGSLVPKKELRMSAVRILDIGVVGQNGSPTATPAATTSEEPTATSSPTKKMTPTPTPTKKPTATPTP